MAVDRRYVVWAYKYFLGREPESERAIESWARGATDIHHLCHGLINSEEFRTRHWQSFAEIEVYRARTRRKLLIGGLAISVVAITLFALGYVAGRLVPL